MLVPVVLNYKTRRSYFCRYNKLPPLSSRVYVYLGARSLDCIMIVHNGFITHFLAYRWSICHYQLVPFCVNVWFAFSICAGGFKIQMTNFTSKSLLCLVLKKIKVYTCSTSWFRNKLHVSHCLRILFFCTSLKFYSDEIRSEQSTMKRQLRWLWTLFSKLWKLISPSCITLFTRTRYLL